MAQVWQIILTVFSSVLASSGLWAYIMKKSERNDARTKMLIGLAHDRILYLGMCYIERGWITQDEYDDWRYHYPEKDKKNIWAKVPSQELSDAILEDLKKED